MEDTSSVQQVYSSKLEGPDPLFTPIHHIGIQTADLESSLRWYCEFFGATANWRMDGGFSDLTRSRLPGIRSLVEVSAGPIRFHLFEREPSSSDMASDTNVSNFQHVCIEVSSPVQLSKWREHWFEVHSSGRHRFVVDEVPTEIAIDDDGVESFYALDLNGLEFEFTYTPRG
ncbi:VOC family protein [Nocardia rhamnosiphila]|uniref:VOC family protein n=1 Tax=Nocardia rhamnosiphila TaxID=426716 RepID=UPI0033D3C436